MKIEARYDGTQDKARLIIRVDPTERHEFVFLDLIRDTKPEILWVGRPPDSSWPYLEFEIVTDLRPKRPGKNK
jgi:hypothetical protein